MKKLWFLLMLSMFSTGSNYAQQIHVGMPLTKLLPILAKQKCNVDTTREGRIKPYITRLEAFPFKIFNVDGRARFCIEPGPDTLYGWEWIADSMSFTDYHIIVGEIAKTLRDTGIKTEPGQIDLSSRLAIEGRSWEAYNTSLSYLTSNQVWMSEGRVCWPTAPETAAPPTPKATNEGVGVGRIVAIGKHMKTVTLLHDDIPGIVNAMTMEYDLASPDLVRSFAVGDYVRFTLVVSSPDVFKIKAMSILISAH